MTPDQTWATAEAHYAEWLAFSRAMKAVERRVLARDGYSDRQVAAILTIGFLPPSLPQDPELLVPDQPDYDPTPCGFYDFSGRCAGPILSAEYIEAHRPKDDPMCAICDAVAANTNTDPEALQRLFHAAEPATTDDDRRLLRRAVSTKPYDQDADRDDWDRLADEFFGFDDT